MCNMEDVETPDSEATYIGFQLHAHKKMKELLSSTTFYQYL